MISVQERQDLITQQELNQEGRFPCRFPGCPKSFKYNGKNRKKPELSPDPPVNVATSDTLSLTTVSTSTPPNDIDDIYNYNTALLAQGLFFLNFLDSVSEGDGDRNSGSTST
ncbi:Hypothetical predicted protein [Paramuricea clavata]|uniref:Uncharacterized protein n=1 Tax=Paramuricea clavata TaxID=317549 RepID=A0A7D9DUU7_PARCT|nr:Hypothetical predicted protein [Paramuricea clavata]